MGRQKTEQKGPTKLPSKKGWCKDMRIATSSRYSSKAQALGKEMGMRRLAGRLLVKLNKITVDGSKGRLMEPCIIGDKQTS